mgnify:CR=1 FL=1
MTKMTKITTCVALLLLVAYLIRTGMQPRPYVFSEGTIANCRQGEAITKPAFVGTQFEGFDFYQSCLDNIRYANPMNRGAR